MGAVALEEEEEEEEEEKKKKRNYFEFLFNTSKICPQLHNFLNH
jgi:hypothetical protein